MNTVKQVDQFWQSMGLPRPAADTIPNTSGYLMITHLVSEEHAEFCKAILDKDAAQQLKEFCDLRYVVIGACVRYGMLHIAEEHIWRDTFADVDEVFHGPLSGHECLQLGLQLLTEGTDVMDIGTCAKGLDQMLFGVNLLGISMLRGKEILDDAFDEVHKANMSKLNSDGTPCKDDSGRVIKGPNYKAPDMEQFV